MIHFVGKGFLTAYFLCGLMQLFSWQPSFSDGVLELTTLGNKLSLKLLFLHVNLVLQGMTDYAATADPDEYHSTVKALKRLVSGTLFK